MVYNFIRVEDEEGVAYLFATDQELVYTVYFKPDEYVEHLTAYPYLLHEGYGFGFYTQGKAKEDPSVFETIVDITTDFFSTVSPSSVLLYHCDFHDSREECRHRLFNKIYNSLPQPASFIKESLEVVFETDDDTIKHYVGFISPNNNPQINKAKEEMEAFSIDLIKDASHKH